MLLPIEKSDRIELIIIDACWEENVFLGDLYICVGEARRDNKGDDSGCGRPPAVVAPPSPPSNLPALDPPISVGEGSIVPR